MSRVFRYSLLFLATSLVLGCLHAGSPVPASTARETLHPAPLDQYVAKADPNYAFELVNSTKGAGWTAYVLDMTSQQWRTAQEVDHPIWKHWLSIVVPEKVSHATALIMIGGGSIGRPAPRGMMAALRNVAVNTQSIVVQINQIPNEPLVFSDDQKKRTEDAIIAYTWDKYMRTGDKEWPLRMPMTKAVVRAMDAAQTFCASKEGGKHRIESFVVAGASKRGWTTWTTAAVDNRIIACIPMVIDLLNVVPSFEHHYAVYAGWAPAIDDYVDLHIMDWLETPEFSALMGLVDPYTFRDRLTMPKFLVNAAGDQFFLPDSSQYYLHDLQGPTYLRYVTNAGHGLRADAVTSVEAFYQAILTDTPLPQYSWSFPDAETIRLETKTKPAAVKLWKADNPEARDFRIDKIGEAYTATELTDQGNGVFVGHVTKPEKGWTAFLVEMTYPGAGKSPFTFTTPVRIVPDITPHTYEPPKELPKGFLTK